MELTINELKQFAVNGTPSSDDTHYEIGKAYMIQTVTMYLKGILEKVTPSEFVINDASWVADTGRFSKFVEGDENINEEEPFAKDQRVIIGRGSMVCAFRLPTITRKLK